MIFATATQAATLTTLQNSPFSIPAATIAAAGLPGSTNLLGSNFMLSALAPATLHGGHASLVNSQQWVRGYNYGTTGFGAGVDSTLIRGDGSMLLVGSSLGQGTGSDIVTLSYAPDGSALWTNRFDGPGHSNDSARFVATDANGDVWVVGTTLRNATTSALADIAVLKYARNGNPLWTNLYTSFDTNSADPTALAVDRFGNAYMEQSAGYSGPFGVGTVVDNSLTKYDSAGDVDWTWHYLPFAPEPSHELRQPGPIAFDDEGNLFVAGNSAGGHQSGGVSLLKYAGDGSVLWTNYHSIQLMSKVDLLSVDRHGDIILTGEVSTNYQPTYVVLKCSNDGASLWTNSLLGPAYIGGNVPQALPDFAGNVFVIGGSPGAAAGFYQILKLSSNGIPLWTNLNANFGPTNGMCMTSAVDSAGNLYLTGYAPGNGYADFITFKFSADGQPIWTNRFDGLASFSDIPYYLAVDDAGSVYVAGQSQLSSGHTDFIIVKYADQLFYTPPKDFIGSDTITFTVTDNFGNSATGSVDILVVPGTFHFNLSPTATRSTPGGFQLQLDGAPNTNPVIIEVTTDLQHWHPIVTNTPVSGSVQFLDSAATNPPPRFYRAHQL
ncbi:MAG: hypothetical protein JWR19_3796 [Pedosphaera sp.]|nr:hypothetical protein [Pedosphaera sp.]